MRHFLLLVALVLFTSISANAQVTLSPTTIFFENNFASIVVINNSQARQDILVDFVFGYPESNEIGDVTMLYDEESPLSNWDVSEYIRAFPRALTLEAGQRQVVRFNIRPPRDLPNGVYWSRIRVTSTPAATEISLEEGQTVGAQFNFIFEQVLGVYYRNGNVRTELSITDSNIIEHNNENVLRFNLSMTGNAPFLGTINLRLLNAQNQVVHEDRQVTSIFGSGFRNFKLPADIASGNYRAEITMQASRPDVPPNFNFPMNNVSYQGSVVVP